MLGEVTDVLEVVPFIQRDSDIGAVVEATTIMMIQNCRNRKDCWLKALAILIYHPGKRISNAPTSLWSPWCVVLSEGERGETDLIQMHFETGDARPIRQHPHRISYSAREEVAMQLKKMQEMSVIQPSKSQWSSPVVLFRKKDGSHRFCVDYCMLNSVMKADTFPLPRIDHLLDKFVKSE